MFLVLRAADATRALEVGANEVNVTRISGAGGREPADACVPWA